MREILEQVLHRDPNVTEIFEIGARTARTNNGVPTNQRFAAIGEKLESINGHGSVSIDPQEFQLFLEQASALGDGTPQSLKSWLEFAEAWKITRALRSCRGNRSATARALGIGRRTLYAKMEKLGITATWGV